MLSSVIFCSEEVVNSEHILLESSQLEPKERQVSTYFMSIFNSQQIG